MSVQAISWVIDHSHQKGGSLVVLLMVANHARSDGTGSWPSIETLARESRMHPRHVLRLLPKLVRSGELEMQHTASPHGTNLYSLPLMQTNPDKMSRDSRDALALTNPVPEMSPEPSLTVLEPSAKSADPSCSRRELRKIQKTLHVLSDRKVQSENTDPMRTHFEVGIYRKHVTGGYFDCIRNGLGEQKAVLEAIRQATLDLTSNRAVELAGCDPDTLRQRTWLRLEPHVAAFAAIRNYDRREELVVQTVIRAVVDEALAFVGRQAAIT